ncbi:hypothetical protein [Legionella brunensis]|uniref:Uncharacterized protein n=1 Tax=Legionella brunensis TaxID=29422 RepID=A0A0W0S0R9_9GAMM|nr:hypothetical protein [Legionella brunensis]KTC76934.1 hypothetical protein Lbru_3041 [Legionella brunensis]
MIKITRDEFLAFALIPDISNAKEVSWFKSNKTGEKLGIIIQITYNHKYDYLIYQKDRFQDYILYPNEDDCSSIDYDNVYHELERKMTV